MKWKACVAWGAAWVWLALFAVSAHHGSIWFDELFSFAQSGLPFRSLLRCAAGDMHPPGYPLLLKMFLHIFGRSWFAARLFSVFAVFLSGIILASCFRDRRSGIIAAGCFLTAPAAGFCAVDIRMYALSMLFLAIFLCSTVRLIDGDAGLKWCVALGGAALGSALTLNYAILYLVIPTVWLTVSLYRARRFRELRNAVVCLLSAVLLYSPWMPFAWRQLTMARGNFWAPPLDAKTILLIFDAPFMGYSPKYWITLIPASAVLLIFSVCAWSSYRNDRRRFLRLSWLLTSAFFPALFGILWSLARGRALIIDRSVLPACVPLALALGEAFASPDVGRRLKQCVAVVLALFFVFHTGCIAYRTRDGELERLRRTLQDEYPHDTLYYSDGHVAADAAGLIPERRHYLLTAESDPMGISVLGNVQCVSSPNGSETRRIFILGDESPEKFYRRYRPSGILRIERRFYSRYRFQHFNICRESTSGTDGHK